VLKERELTKDRKGTSSTVPRVMAIRAAGSERPFSLLRKRTTPRLILVPRSTSRDPGGRFFWGEGVLLVLIIIGLSVRPQGELQLDSLADIAAG
jgi:hypothetical protein